MARVTGSSRSMPLSRRMINEFLYFSRNIPMVPMERRMSLAPLVAARQAASPRPGWCVIFTKAYATVCARNPHFRETLMSFPWTRLYRCDEPIASIIVERVIDDEAFLLPLVIRSPHKESLFELQGRIEHAQTAPPREVRSFRETLRIGKMPLPLRRFCWWFGLRWWGHMRVKSFGTFGVSVTAGMGASSLAVQTPWTSMLHYGMFDKNGDIDVRVSFDHRVLDGAPVSRAMVEMEKVLMGEILEELRGMSVARAA